MNNSGLQITFSRNPAWCRRRTTIERRLILLSLIILSIALALTIALAIVVYKKSADDDAKTCSTPECIHAASNILKFIDPSVDPCDNFYEFACGNYLKEALIPDDKSEVGLYATTVDNVRDQINAIIEEPVQPRARKPFKMLKQYYDLCMNTTAIEADGLKTAKAILKGLGGWPLLEGKNWNEGKFNWTQSVYTFRKLGFSVSYFLNFEVGIDNKNSSKRVIILDQAALSFSREFLIKGFEEKLVKAYYDYMVDVAVIFGASRAAALKEMKESLEFEIELANISRPKEEQRNMTLLYNPMSVKELQHGYPNINWLEYLNNVLDIPDIEITYDEIVLVKVPKYITNLIDVLQRTPKRIQANYVIRRVALSLVFFLTEELREKQLDYINAITGQREKESRWKQCTRLASGNVYLASGSLYVQKHFKGDAKKQAQEMVSDIRAEFERMVKEAGWIDDATRQNALEKAASMATHIGYPDELLDEDKIDKYYANLELDPDSYLESMRALLLFGKEYSYKKLRNPVNKTDWVAHSNPTEVNAFYSHSENSMTFSAGILQGMFFNANGPAYMNYGGIGQVIGHEITHGFDDQGRQYDKDGNLKDWWTESTKKAFMKRAQCIIDQYGNYTVPEVGLKLNGINTQGENIADNGGIKEAYLAYNKWVGRNGEEPRLPGVNHTPKQLFWISAALTWCSKSRKEDLKMHVIDGNHSPDLYRVLIPFANSDYFAKDFHCPVGSTMNPTHKCKVW